MIVQLPKSVFSYDVRDFLHFMLIKFADCVPHPKKRIKTINSMISLNFLKQLNQLGCRHRRAGVVHPVGKEHQNCNPWLTSIPPNSSLRFSLASCIDVFIYSLLVSIYTYIYISAINNEIRRAMEGWGILCRCCDDILMAILFTGFEVYRGTFP